MIVITRSMITEIFECVGQSRARKGDVATDLCAAADTAWLKIEAGPRAQTRDAELRRVLDVLEESLRVEKE